MTTIIRYSLVLTMLFCMAFSANAQKFGYTNSQAILVEMPDVKLAESKLETLQKQLQTRYEQLMTKYQQMRGDLEKRYGEGTLSQVQLDAELKVLGDKEKEIIDYEKDMMNQMQTRRAKEIQPILEKVQDAIDMVAKEQGYQYIFDQGSGVLLYAKEEDDITPLVKAKLGM